MGTSRRGMTLIESCWSSLRSLQCSSASWRRPSSGSASRPTWLAAATTSSSSAWPCTATTLTKGCFPPGLSCSGTNISDAEASGFTHLLPHLEQDNVYRLYHFDVPWYVPENYQAVGLPVQVFFCPSNRDQGWLDLAPIAAQWHTSLPPVAASCDFAFCREPPTAPCTATGRVSRWEAVRRLQHPPARRSTAGRAPDRDQRRGQHDLRDGGEAVGGSPIYPVRVTWRIQPSPPSIP